jgi:hypothetical protein
VAEEKKQNEKSLEMRVAELEDKLAKLHITEEEMRAYHKVSNLLGGQPAAPAETLGGAQGCIVSRGVACTVFGPCYAMPSPIHGCCILDCASCVISGWGRSGGGRPGALPISRPAGYLPFENLGF